ncbi:transcription factor [Fusarium flagelliforme]|uniref:Transcription factor n=1 Tax=Fusarium flagelliforme TaxID=2675880 RepID=A0A395M8A4_9HYPO|nr:transcription factor [Fusarium flagelliforme]
MTTATIEKAFSPPQVSDLHSTKDERHAHALNIQARIRENKQYRDLVGKEWKQFQLKAIHVSTTVPKRPHAGKGRTSSKKRTGQPVPTCHEESSESEAGPSRPSKPGKNVDDADFRPSTVSRNENEKKRCRKREGSKCLYTAPYLLDIVGFGLYCSGFKPPHTEPEKADTEPEWDITIQFYWLQHRDAKPERIVLEGNDNGFMEMADAQIKYEEAGSDPSKHSQGDGHIDTMTTIISGDEFTLTMPKEDAFKCKKESGHQ